MSRYSRLTSSNSEDYYWDHDDNDSDNDDAQLKDSFDDDENYAKRLNSTPSNSTTNTLSTKFQKLTSRFLQHMPKDNRNKYSMMDENENDNLPVPEHNISELTRKLQKIDSNDKKGFKRALKDFLTPEILKKYSSATLKWKLYSMYPDKVKLISKVLKKKGMNE